MTRYRWLPLITLFVGELVLAVVLHRRYPDDDIALMALIMLIFSWWPLAYLWRSRTKP